MRPDPLRKRPFLRLVRLAVFLLVVGVAIEPTMEMFGHPIQDGLTLSTLVHWLLTNGLRVLLIVGMAIVVVRAASLGADRLEEFLSQASGASAVEQAKRAHTIAELVRSLGRIFVIVSAGLMVLSEVGINTAPLLAGAGIAGLAIGFGSQTLVKDMLSGFFIIFDNQVRVGDTAEINGVTGAVEAMTLRTIVVRDARGAVYVFPCGSITKLANLTKDFAFAFVDVPVDVRYDIDEVVAILAQVATGIRADVDRGSAILGPLDNPSVEQVTDTGVTIRVRLMTMPQRQGEIAGELRRRVKRALQEKGIEGPVTQSVRIRT